MAETDESILVSRVRNGDLNAFEALYDKYKSMVYRTACAITHDQSAAEEVTQECFVRAYRHMSKVDTSTSLGPWLHRIAANLSYNWWRNTRRQPFISLGAAVEEMSVSPSHSPARTAQRSEINELIKSALESLCFEQRVTLILFYLNNFSVEEIAYVLDCPAGTVKSRLHYGRANLKRKLQHAWAIPAEVAFEY